MPALWRHRPVAVFIGSEQARLASRMLPFRGRGVIPYGLPPSVLVAAAEDVAAEAGAVVAGREAIFTSQAYRGLARVIRMWRECVAPAVPGARLTAYVGAGDVAAYRAKAAGEASIRVLGRVGNDEMLGVLRGARVLLAPGHRSETFCLAAAEAIAMGVPVVTLGIGSLKERVVDGRTGFVCRDWGAMAARTRDLLTEDALWAEMRAAGLATRAGNGWDRAAVEWEAFADGF
jgi:glycosyltransferase involved in cell wall biosynthesis